MAGLPFFVASCSSCHRRHQLQIQMLGKQTTCSSCGKSYIANDPNAQSAAIDDPLNYWIRFTDHAYSQEDFEASFDRDIARTPR